LFTLSEQGFITAFAPQVNPLSGTTEINKFTSSFAAGSAGSGSFQPFSIAYTINNAGAQTGTATGIFLSATETALGGMAHNLIDLKVGTASVFSVSSSGITKIGPALDKWTFSSNVLSNVANVNITGVQRVVISNTGITGGLQGSGSGGLAADTGAAVVATKNASSVLECVSTTRGFLLPRMTTTQRTGISSPANGLMVYDTDLGQPCFYDTVNTRWNKISHSAA
jgi:hypothetical protein